MHIWVNLIKANMSLVKNSIGLINPGVPATGRVTYRDCAASVLVSWLSCERDLVSDAGSVATSRRTVW